MTRSENQTVTWLPVDTGPPTHAQLCTYT